MNGDYLPDPNIAIAILEKDETIPNNGS